MSTLLVGLQILREVSNLGDLSETPWVAVLRLQHAVTRLLTLLAPPPGLNRMPPMGCHIPLLSPCLALLTPSITFRAKMSNVLKSGVKSELRLFRRRDAKLGSFWRQPRWISVNGVICRRQRGGKWWRGREWWRGECTLPSVSLATLPASHLSYCTPSVWIHMRLF